MVKLRPVRWKSIGLRQGFDRRGIICTITGIPLILFGTPGYYLTFKLIQIFYLPQFQQVNEQNISAYGNY